MTLGDWASLAILAVSLAMLLDWLVLYARAVNLSFRIQGWMYALALTVLMLGVVASAASQRTDYQRIEQRIERQEEKIETLTAQLMQHQVQVAGRLAALETSVQSGNAILTSLLVAVILMIVGGVARFLWSLKKSP